MNSTPLLRPWRTIGVAIVLIVLGVYSNRISTILNTAAWETIKVVLLALLVHSIERDFLWKDLRKNLSEVVKEASTEVSHENNALIRAAAESGLTSIYLNREAAMKDIEDAIGNSTSRVWLLAVAFSEKLNLDALVEGLRTKLGKNTEPKKDFDLKILVADPLRSPAVFRSFLETTPEQIGDVYNYPRPSGTELDPFCGQTLYKQVLRVFHLLEGNGNEALRDLVRFYAHDPSCWLVIVDQTAFFEPYTFGKPEEVKPGAHIGGYFPVFRFESSSQAKSFQILTDHFSKLWITTDMDWFHFRARLSDLSNAIDSVFRRRGDDWFRRVWKTMEKWYSETETAKKDERRCPRMLCLSEDPTLITLSWSENGNQKKATAKRIRDFSRYGISLTFDNGIQIPDEQIARLSAVQTVPQNSSAQVQFLLNHFVNCDLKVVLPKSGNPLVVGLQKVA